MICKYSQLCPVTFGAGSITTAGEACKELGAQKILIVTGKNVKSTGIPQKVIDSIKAEGIEYEVFDGVKMDAPDYTVEEGANQAKKMGADAVIGIGGGSTLDTAKGIAVVGAGDISLQEILASPPQPRNQLKTIMIPTTSGTGSESTFIAVITNTNTHYKTGVLAYPHAAIVDPELTLGLAKDVTMYTGMDAFSHANESLSSALIPNPHSDLLAYNAMERIIEWLPAAIADPDNLEARENLALASNFAGKAFTDATVHLGHAMAHSLGANYHIPHGIGCALVTPVIIEYMAPVCPEKYKKVGGIVGAVMTSDNPEIFGKEVAGAVRQFMKKIGVPSCKDLGISRDDVISCCSYVKNEPMSMFGQRKPTENDIINLMGLVYDGYQK